MNQIQRIVVSLLGLLPFVVIAIVLLFDVEQVTTSNSSTPMTVETDSLLVKDSDGDAAVSFKPFDPNRDDYAALIHAGVPRQVAVSLLKWRKSGKVFRIKEDVALCYNLSDSLYFLLEPYIIIGEEYAPRVTQSVDYTPKPREVHLTPQPFSLDTVGAAYLRAIGFSRRQATNILQYRDLIGGYRDFEEFTECYSVSDSMAEYLRPYICFEQPKPTATPAKIRFPIDINSADSAMLCAVRGIGPSRAMAILKYRELVGGYYDVTQILDLEIIPEADFYQFSSQIWCDSSKIKKININFARPNEMVYHPYVSRRNLRRIINHRELKGGWSTIEEMIESNIFTKEEAQRIAPYLDFGTNPE